MDLTILQPMPDVDWSPLESGSQTAPVAGSNWFPLQLIIELLIVNTICLVAILFGGKK